MNIRIMLSAEEIKIIHSALDQYGTGAAEYTMDMLEKIQMYLEAKLAEVEPKIKAP